MPFKSKGVTKSLKIPVNDHIQRKFLKDQKMKQNLKVNLRITTLDTGIGYKGRTLEKPTKCLSGHSRDTA
ncbi:hypothetical protein EK904_004856 [Melospiza melodia maxima]|nr:hypothetical protein EK904_004856 [Melospiza melodia maxima]